MVFLHRGVDGAQLGASLIESGSGSKTPKKLRHAMDAAGNHSCGKMMRTGDYVRDDLGILRIWDAGFEDANDGRRAVAYAAEANGFADDRGVLVKRIRPETIGENDHAVGFGAVVLRSDEAAEHRMQAHHVEIRATNHATANGTRLTEADHGETHNGEVPERAHGFHAAAQILDLRYGKRGVVVAHAWGALPDIDQPVLVAVHQRLQQDAAHQGENGSIRADAERQCQNYGDRQPGRTTQRVNRNSQIANE